jgi:hypothetical protein
METSVGGDKGTARTIKPIAITKNTLVHASLNSPIAMTLRAKKAA